MRSLTEIEFKKVRDKAKAAVRLDGKKHKFSCRDNIIGYAYPSGETILYCNKPFTKIGDANHMSLGTARAKVKEITEQNAVQMREEKAEAERRVTSPTLAEYFPQWLQLKTAEFKQGSGRVGNFKSLFKHLEGLYDVQLSDIDVAVLKKGFPLSVSTPLNMYNAASMLSQLLDYAVAEQLIEENKIGTYLRSKASIYKKPKKTKDSGMKSVPAEMLRAIFFEPLKNTPLVSRAFYLMIALSSFRFDECRLLMWDYIDWKKQTITIPPDAVGANKTQRDNVKPLTRQMLSFLKWWKDNYKEEGDVYLFQSHYSDKKAIPVGANVLREPHRALGIGKIHDFHGFRKSMYTWLYANHMELGAQVIELCGGHDVRNQIQKTYDKNDYIEEIRSALQLWDDYLEKVVLPAEYTDLMKSLA